MADRGKTKPATQRPSQHRRPAAERLGADPKRDEPGRKTADEKLDEALLETFPASDPAVSTPRKS